MTTNVVSFELLQQVLKQLFFVTLGYSSYFVLSKYIPVTRMKKIMSTIMILSIILLFIPLFESARNGAQAWITLPGGITLQPSEFIKLVVIVVNSVYLGDLKVRKKDFSQIVQYPLGYLALVTIIIVFIQKDLGSGVVVFLIGISTYMLAGHNKLKRSQYWLIGLMFVGIFALPLLLTSGGISWIETTGILKGYMLNRFKVVINPFEDLYGSGYQLVNGMVAMVRGGLFGVGYGNGLQKYGYLPAAKTDYILAVIGEEMGFVGILIVFVLFIIIIFRLINHTFKAQSEKNRIILFGVMMYVSLHFILNVGGVTGLIPLTGVPLLLLSAGGSSTLSVMMALGMAQFVIVEESKLLLSKEEKDTR
jgi:cell division protein FtsW